MFTPALLIVLGFAAATTYVGWVLRPIRKPDPYWI
jgi:hypothetical protein